MEHDSAVIVAYGRERIRAAVGIDAERLAVYDENERLRRACFRDLKHAGSKR